MKKSKFKCVICNKSIDVKIWKSRSKFFKNHMVISSVFCSSYCRKRFGLFIKLNDVLEALLNQKKR